MSLASTRLLAGLLFGVEATNLTTYACVGVGLAVVAVIASWAPARRAMGPTAVVLRADPLLAPGDLGLIRTGIAIGTRRVASAVGGWPW